MSNFGVVMDELSIEVTETKKIFDFFNLCGAWPFGNALDLSGVHAHIAITNDDAKIFNGSLIKEAFFRFEVKVIFG